MKVITKQEARVAGLSRYFTGKPCSAGHLAERFVSGGCVVCGPARSRAWYDRNAESQRARSLAYRNSNIDLAREKSRSYNEANLPRLAAIARNRRARARNNGGAHTAEDIAEILEMQRGRCAYCRARVFSSYHVDHITPLARGGSNGRDNLQILCVRCNKTKSAKDPIVFAQSLGMLL